MAIRTAGAPAPRVRASEQDGRHPRPQLLRASWVELSGDWGFDFDDADVGLAEHWERDREAGRRIVVPFPPESPASGIGDTGFHRVVWYWRDLTSDDLAAAGWGSQGDRLLIHFAAVDYRAAVWLNGVLLGHHEGGHVPFACDATDALVADGQTQRLVVRAEDDPADVAQPRGKQDWQERPHSIWYHRTTGIWQPVWLEAVPAVRIEHLSWIPDRQAGTVRLAVRLSRRATTELSVHVVLDHQGEPLAELSLRVDGDRAEVDIPLAGSRNGQDSERLLWSPEHPRLIDARVELSGGAADPPRLDTVDSYFGMRSAAAHDGRFLLNGRPYFVRGVLEQGYWPQSHLAAPSAEAIRAEVELILELGFNAARLHQKIEDPRLLFWADRLGLLVWGETPSAFEFSPTAVRRMTAEWVAAIERDVSHPCLVTWVPMNESWGVQQIADDDRMRHYASGLAELTRALDPSRPVITNDGWEHLDSDLATIHDYEPDGASLAARYGSADAVEQLVRGIGPAGRRILLTDAGLAGRPVMLTEFGGISFASSDSPDDSWGYSTATGSEDFESRLRAIIGAANGAQGLAGWVYTQLTDTLQETNGLTDEQRVPKLPASVIRSIVRGES